MGPQPVGEKGKMRSNRGTIHRAGLKPAPTIDEVEKICDIAISFLEVP